MLFIGTKTKNNDVRPGNFNWIYTLKVLLILVCIAVFFDNPGNSIMFSIYPLEEAARLSLRPPVIIFGGILLGPLWGGVIGGLVDLISFFIWHSDLEYMFVFTLITILRGFMAGYIYNYMFNKMSLKAVFISITVSHLLVSALAIPMVLNRAYGVPLLDNMVLRLAIQLFTIPAYTLITYYILRAMKESKELQALHLKMKKMIKTDELTGIFNRRYFMEYLERMYSLAQRKSHSIYLVMADIDKFKNINDSYGHNVGDEVLIEVGKVFKEETRKEDMAARIGGEEFAILLTETNLIDVIKVAERIRKRIAQLRIPPVKNKITVSLGVTQLQNNDSIKIFLTRADNALYLAKNSGRDRVKKIL